MNVGEEGDFQCPVEAFDQSVTLRMVGGRMVEYCDE